MSLHRISPGFARRLAPCSICLSQHFAMVSLQLHRRRRARWINQPGQPMAAKPPPSSGHTS
jgi:hypothetical protein